MKKISLILAASGLISGTLALSVGEKSISKADASSSYTVTTNWESFGKSGTEIGSGSFGDECKVSFSTNKNTTSKMPTNYQSSGGGIYYIGLQYNPAKTVGTLGAYVEFSCSEDYTFDSMSWNEFKSNSVNTSGCKIEIKSQDDQSFSDFKTIEKITSTSGVSYNFEGTTQNIRIYHYFAEGTESAHSPLYISDITFGLSPLVSNILTFDTNGGESMSPVKYGLSQNTVEPATPFKASTSETKYEFAGWYTDKACTEGKEFSFGNVLTEDTTIYAKWNEIEIESSQLSSNFYKEAVKRGLASGASYSFKNSSLDFDLFDGDTADGNFYMTVTASETQSCNLRNYVYEQTDDSYVQLSSGHSAHFTGGVISIKPINNQTTFAIQSISFELDKNPSHVSGSGCISYRYSVDGKTFTNFSNGDSFTNYSFTISSLPTKVRYFDFFIDKYNSVSTSAFITKVTVNYAKESSHTLSFDTNGGGEIESVTLGKNEITVAPANPVRPNEGSTKFTFAGWYKDKACTEGNEFTFGNVLTENTTIYAKWTESQVTGYSLTFHTNGAHSIEAQIAEEGSCFNEPIISGTIEDEKYIYTLTGWFADEKLTIPFDFSTVYTENKDAYAKYSYQQNTIPGATSFGMKNNVQKYCKGWSIEAYEEHVLDSSSVSLSMVDSTFSFTAAYGDDRGIKMTGSKNESGEITYKYDVRMNGCLVVWELHDYTKYISTVRWDLKNTGYKYDETFIVDLFDNPECAGSPVDSDHLSLASSDADRCIQMLNNTDETVNAVAFRQRNVSFDYGFEYLQYILGEASANQQVKNFAKDFMKSITCSGTGSVTFESGVWNTISSRVSKMSSDAKNLLRNYNGDDMEVIDALERYDYIVGKYGTNSYSNFLNRTVSLINGSYFGLFSSINESSSAYIVITCISVISLTAFCCLYASKKRKENL